MFYDTLACNLQIKQKDLWFGELRMKSDKISQGKFDYKKGIYANA